LPALEPFKAPEHVGVGSGLDSALHSAHHRGSVREILAFLFSLRPEGGQVAWSAMEVAGGLTRRARRQPPPR